MEFPFEITHNRIQFVSDHFLFVFYSQADLIPKTLTCPHCNQQISNKYSISGNIRCHLCNAKLSSFSGSIFFNKKLSLSQFHYILISFLNSLPITQVSKCFSDSEINISHKTIIKYYKIFRTLLIGFMENFINSVHFSGTCEIDEALITARRIGNHGRFPKIPIWVFGILERNSGNCILYLVPNRRTNKIFPIIGKHIDNSTQTT